MNTTAIAVALCAVPVLSAIAQNRPTETVATVPPHVGAIDPTTGRIYDSQLPLGRLKNCLLGLPDQALCPLAQALGPTPALPTTGGMVRVTDQYNYGVVEVSAAAPTTITWACDGVLQGFTVKDMLGNDKQFPITLMPSSGALDGAATYTMSASAVPPFEWRSIICDAQGHSLLF